MKKYLLISLLLHLILLWGLKDFNNIGNESLNKHVPISFVVTKTSPKPGSKVLADQEQKELKKSAPPEKKKEKVKEKKEKKKEIKSKIENKKKKKEKKKEKVIDEIVKNKKIENKDIGKSEIDSEEKISNDTKGEGQGVFSGSNFVVDGDGGYIALSSAGINYQILNEVEPDYPSQAESIGYSKRVVVTVKFLVGLKGNIEKVQIIKSHAKLGFDSEVRKAIGKWRFKPIVHHGKNIKVYFVKDFIFQPR